MINYFVDVVFHSPIALPIPCAGDSDNVKVFVWFEDALCVNPADCPKLSLHRLVTTENASPILESEDDLDFRSIDETLTRLQIVYARLKTAAVSRNWNGILLNF